jgi:hypothetical protein
VKTSTLSDYLTVQKAVTARQLRNELRLSARAAHEAGWPTVRTQVTDTAGGTKLFAVTFVCATQGVARASAASLRHYAGVAALRLHLNVPLTQWRVTSIAEGYQIPDGVWHYEGRDIAAEYDAGEYSKKRLFEKVRNYSLTYSYQIWGTASEVRVKVIHQVLETIGVPGRVYFIPWRG